MKKHFSKIIIVTLLTIGFVLPAVNLAAGKPTLCKKSLELTVGNTVKLTIKNADKKAKVVWKTTKKTVVKIVKKKSSGKKLYAKIKGIISGKATVKAVYKSGRIKKTLKCKISVKDVNSVQSANTPDSGNQKSVSTAEPDKSKKSIPTATPGDPTPKPGNSTPKPGDPTPTPGATATPEPGDDGNLIDHEANGKEAEISFEDIINNGH